MRSSLQTSVKYATVIEQYTRSSLQSSMAVCHCYWIKHEVQLADIKGSMATVVEQYTRSSLQISMTVLLLLWNCMRGTDCRHLSRYIYCRTMHLVQLADINDGMFTVIKTYTRSSLQISMIVWLLLLNRTRGPA